MEMTNYVFASLLKMVQGMTVESNIFDPSFRQGVGFCNDTLPLPPGMLTYRYIRTQTQFAHPFSSVSLFHHNTFPVFTPYITLNTA